MMTIKIYVLESAGKLFWADLTGDCCTVSALGYMYIVRVEVPKHFFRGLNTVCNDSVLTLLAQTANATLSKSAGLPISFFISSSQLSSASKLSLFPTSYMFYVQCAVQNVYDSGNDTWEKTLQNNAVGVISKTCKKGSSLDASPKVPVRLWLKVIKTRNKRLSKIASVGRFLLLVPWSDLFHPDLSCQSVE